LSNVTTNQKGAIAELAITMAAVRLGVDVYRPVAEGGRYDLIFDLRGRLARVQCKWAPLVGDVILIRCDSCRRAPEGLRARKYAVGEIDAYAAYCAEVDRCYFLAYEEFGGRRQIGLRISRTRNNQNLGVNWASTYEFEATLPPSGAVAQLGERLAGSQKGTGSSPVGSTLFDV
jgi:PD-(D/E)XK endonuclease